MEWNSCKTCTMTLALAIILGIRLFRLAVLKENPVDPGCDRHETLLCLNLCSWIMDGKIAQVRAFMGFILLTWLVWSSSSREASLLSLRFLWHCVKHALPQGMVELKHQLRREFGEGERHTQGRVLPQGHLEKHHG